ncbi:iron chelate uptake ABC transporter family permease subunit [Paenibacillus harenae]|uniref:iron chelate uptake ABC transporter family permease subunit n=1 Tax=Paenibacillus harenae TaxID=306543 RepID=UPI0027909EF1|nr:iron chelate uptake ABC transporter family permease subunit [Paenibacillus harenae]MDQ0063606.1 iron complex transport system permease protein [Paenibacillus harenae]
MRDHWKLLLLAALALGLTAVFLTIDASGDWDYVLPRRARKIGAIALTGAAIAYSTVVFQTLTNNKILTPSLIGLDSLYLLLHTVIIFVFGSSAFTAIGKHEQFALSVILMVAFSGLLFRMLFRIQGRYLYFLLLVGIVCGTFFSSISSFLQMLLDPNDFLLVQDKMFASFNNVNSDILLMAALISIAAVSVFYREFKYLDVIALGREHAVNLGVPYDRTVRRMLICVAVLVATSTALVGPITFLGLLVANVAYRVVGTYRHSTVLPAAILISVASLIGGQLVVERIFTFSTSLSVILNFIGGGYFLILMLKEDKT